MEAELLLRATDAASRSDAVAQLNKKIAAETAMP